MIQRILTLALLTLTFLSAMAYATPGNNSGNKPDHHSDNILIAYFSYSGNTRALAQLIQSQTGCDLFEIRTAKAYPKEYTPCTEVAKADRDNNERPALQDNVQDMSRYSTIYVGCPSWWHTAPMAVLTFLESHDFTGKTIIPFCTHESVEDGAFAAIEKATPGATHLKGFDVYGTRAARCLPQVQAWLREIGQLPQQH